MEWLKDAQRVECPMEMFSDRPHAIMADIHRRFATDDNNIRLFFFTFINDGWQKKTVTIFLFNQFPSLRIPVTAAVDDLKYACKWVVDHNSHLMFLNELPAIETNEFGATAIFGFDME